MQRRTPTEIADVSIRTQPSTTPRPRLRLSFAGEPVGRSKGGDASASAALRSVPACTVTTSRRGLLVLDFSHLDTGH